jgi:hypothetical protein
LTLDPINLICHLLFSTLCNWYAVLLFWHQSINNHFISLVLFSFDLNCLPPPTLLLQTVPATPPVCSTLSTHNARATWPLRYESNKTSFYCFGGKKRRKRVANNAECWYNSSTTSL